MQESHFNLSRSTRKMRLWLLSAAIAGSTIVASHAANAQFTDTERHWAASVIDWATDEGIAAGYEDGSFRPNVAVGERDFLVMLMRAYPELGMKKPAAGQPWYEPAYDAAEALNWPVGLPSFKRGDVAVLLAALHGQSLTRNDAVAWVLRQKLATGKTSATVSGFAPDDPLTRAEALTFIANAKRATPSLDQPPKLTEPAVQAKLSLAGIELGDAAADVALALGQPNRKDAAANGLIWHVYNADYAKFAMIAVQNGKVVGLYSNANAWDGSYGIRIGMNADKAAETLKAEQAGTVRSDDNYLDVSAGDVNYMLYVDHLADATLSGLLAIEREAVDALVGATASGSFSESFERQTFDIASAERVRHGLQPFTWDDDARTSSRAHSKDMAVRDFFEHENPDGDSPFDRMEAVGIDYRSAAENIAAGYGDPFHVHAGWMNSAGHRKNMLNPSLERLGVGVYVGGEYGYYYTQNFYTPMDR